MFMWPAASPPGGYLICDGTAYSQTGYAALFSIISTIYNTQEGMPDPGPGLFRVPNFQGRVALGAGQSSAAGATNHALASSGGEETHVLVIAELAAHAHIISASEAAHVHTVPVHGHAWNDNNHAHISPSHGHGFNDPRHYHYNPNTIFFAYAQGGGNSAAVLTTAGQSGSYTPTGNYAYTGCSVAASGDFWTNGNLTNWGAVGSVANAAAFNTSANAGAVTATAANTGSSTPFNELPPYLTINYIIKV
jgi:microcystin-dependent protein